MNMDKENNKQQQQRPPTPRWNPSIIVSPTTSFLHQRRINPKIGQPCSSLRQSNVISDSYLSNFQSGYRSHQRAPSPTSSNSAQPKAVPSDTGEQFQQPLAMTIDPRHVSFTLKPDFPAEIQYTIDSLPHLSGILPSPSLKTIGLTPPSSLLWSLSPNIGPQGYYSQSPFPHRYHSDTIDQPVTVNPVESDSHLGNALLESNSIYAACPSVGGKAPRLALRESTTAKAPKAYSNKHQEPSKRPYRSHIEDVTPMEGQSTLSEEDAMLKNKASSTHDSVVSSARGGTHYARSSLSLDPSSTTNTRLSEDACANMELQIRIYNADNERKVKEILDKRLPLIFHTCNALICSMSMEDNLRSALDEYHRDVRIINNQRFTGAVAPYNLKYFTANEPEGHIHGDSQNSAHKMNADFRSDLETYIERDHCISTNDVYLENINSEEEDTHETVQVIRDTHVKEHTPSPIELHQECSETNLKEDTNSKSNSPNSYSSVPSESIVTVVPPSFKSLEGPSSEHLHKEQIPTDLIAQESYLLSVSQQEPEYQLRDIIHLPQGHCSKQSPTLCKDPNSGKKRKQSQDADMRNIEYKDTNFSIHIDGIREDNTYHRAEVQHAPLFTSYISSTNAQSQKYSGLQLNEQSGISTSPPGPSDCKAQLLMISPNKSNGDTLPQLITWNKEFIKLVDYFQACCIRIMICLQQPSSITSQAFSPSGSMESHNLAHSVFTTPTHPSEKRDTTEYPSPMAAHLNIQQIPLSIKTKLKGELTKLLKGGNDILNAIEKYNSERAEILIKIEGCRTNIDCNGCYQNKCDKKSLDRKSSDIMNEKKRHDIGNSTLTQMELNLEMLDMRQLSRVRSGVLELQASCVGLYQMLLSVFG